MAQLMWLKNWTFWGKAQKILWEKGENAGYQECIQKASILGSFKIRDCVVKG